MSRITYLRLAAALPLVLPLVGALVLWRGFNPLSLPGLLIASLVLGGAPYALAAGVALVLLRHQPARTYWSVALVAPLLFVPIFGLCLPLISLFDGSEPPDTSTWLISGGFFALYILPLGYFYVLISWVGYRWCDRHGLFGHAAQQGTAAAVAQGVSTVLW